MPLLPGKKNIGKNIKEMENAGYKPDVAKAAALNKALGPKKKKVKKKQKSTRYSNAANSGLCQSSCVLAPSKQVRNL